MHSSSSIRFRRYVLLSCVSGALASCTRSVAPPVEYNPAPARQLDVLRFEDRFWAHSGPPDSGYSVISDSVAWRELWNYMQKGNWPQKPVPVVDFSREVLLVAAWGGKGTNGYTITIDSAVVAGDAVEVHVDRVESCHVGMLVTTPVDIVRLARQRSRIIFVDKPPRWSC